jgi:hypothetical protein
MVNTAFFSQGSVFVHAGTAQFPVGVALSHDIVAGPRLRVSPAKCVPTWLDILSRACLTRRVNLRYLAWSVKAITFMYIATIAVLPTFFNAG